MTPIDSPHSKTPESPMDSLHGWVFVEIIEGAPRPLGNFEALIFQGSPAEARKAIDETFGLPIVFVGDPEWLALHQAPTFSAALAKRVSIMAKRPFQHEIDGLEEISAPELWLRGGPCSLSKAIDHSKHPHPKFRALFIADRATTLAMAIGLQKNRRPMDSIVGGSPLEFGAAKALRVALTKRFLEESRRCPWTSGKEPSDIKILGEALLGALAFSAHSRRSLLAAENNAGKELASQISPDLLLLAWRALEEAPAQATLASLAADFIANPETISQQKEIIDGLFSCKPTFEAMLASLVDREAPAGYEEAAVALLEKRLLDEAAPAPEAPSRAARL